MYRNPKLCDKIYTILLIFPKKSKKIEKISGKKGEKEKKGKKGEKGEKGEKREEKERKKERKKREYPTMNRRENRRVDEARQRRGAADFDKFCVVLR